MSAEYDISICADCVTWQANAEIADDTSEDRADEILNAVPDRAYVWLYEDLDEHFSSLPCELCNSPLGGNRYAAAIYYQTLA